jgi:hypothetical protein
MGDMRESFNYMKELNKSPEFLTHLQPQTSKRRAVHLTHCLRACAFT